VVFLNVLGGILGGDGLIHGGEAVCVLMVWLADVVCGGFEGLQR